LRFAPVFSRLPSPPTAKLPVDAISLILAHASMHLASCAAPSDPLEVAPRSALLSDSTDAEQWDAFWSSDAYFVRRTTGRGDVEWFELVDDEPTNMLDARVLTLQPKTRARTRVAVVVAQSPDGRRMLVGSAGRTPR